MPIDCLLGADNCWQFLEGSVIQGDFPGPVAVLSIFGWLLSGPVNVQGNNHLSINLISTHVLKTESFVVKQDATLKEELSNAGINFIHNHPPRTPGDLNQKFDPTLGHLHPSFCPGGRGTCWGSSRGAGIVYKRCLPFLEFSL